MCDTETTLARNFNPSPSLLQIYSLDTTSPTDFSLKTTEGSNGMMRLEFAMCIDVGEAWEIKWCPKGGETADDAVGVVEGERLGLLAGAFADGGVSLFMVPHPDAVQLAAPEEVEGPVFSE